MSWIKDKILRTAVGVLPNPLELRIKEYYHRQNHWAHPQLKQFGTVQDLYYWVADGSLDTVLPLQNYFSAFYPQLDTSTTGTISILSSNGKKLGTKIFRLSHYGGAKFRVSSLLDEMHQLHTEKYGTLEVNIEIPKAVYKAIKPQHAFYFWDRFYIGYTNTYGQIIFVHGVDKTNIYHVGESTPTPWYAVSKNKGWAPETPVDIDQYSKYTVIMINRSQTDANISLTVADHLENSVTWSADIFPSGVHRFEFSSDSLVGLTTKELKMRIDGMASDYGRPMVFKEFPSGAISAMHC